MILGKSNHPVEIKQIPLKSWPLRAEIEVALKTCLKEDGTLDEAKAENLRALFDKISYPDQAPVVDIQNKKTDETSKDNTEDESNSTEPSDEEAKDEVETKTSEQSEQNETNNKWGQRYRPEEDQIFSGKSLLSDIHMDSIVFFSEKEYTPGQTITLEIINAKPFCLHVKINNVINFARNSKVITPTKMTYRILGTFLFPFEEQRQNLRTFLQKIEPEMLSKEREKKRLEEEKSPDTALDKAEEDAAQESETAEQPESPES